MTKFSKYLAKILYFLPLCGWASFVTIFTLSTLAGGTFKAECHNDKSPYRFYDFCVHYAGAQIAKGNDRTMMYTPALQQVYVSELHGPVDLSTDTLLMKSAPFLPCLLIPLAYLPIEQAFNLYLLGCIACYFAGFYLLTSLRPDKPGPLMTLFLAWAFAGTVPIFTGALLGQISPYLFFIVALYLYLLCKQKDIAAGVMLALSSFKPHYAFFWALPALGLKRWRLLLAAAVTELALLLVSVLILGWPAIASYPSAIVNGDNIAQWSHVGILMISLRGILFSICNTPLWLPVTVVFALAGEIALFIMWRRYKNADAKSGDKPIEKSGDKSIEKSIEKSGDEKVGQFPSKDWQTWRWLYGSTVILCLFCAAHAYIYDAILLTIAGVFCVDFDWFNKDKVVRPSEKFIQIMLLATPYIQWLGMIVLPTNYRRSLPTSFILLALTAAIVVRMFRAKAKDAAVAAKT